MDAYTVLMIARSADWPSKRPDPSAPTVVFVVPSRSVVLEGQQLAMGVLAGGEDSTHRTGQGGSIESLERTVLEGLALLEVRRQGLVALVAPQALHRLWLGAMVGGR